MSKLSLTVVRECEATLSKMRQASGVFYSMAVRIGCHPFIEFTGLMNEYIHLCSDALDKGIDFRHCHKHSETHLPVHAFRLEYLREKLECVFGESLSVVTRDRR